MNLSANIRAHPWSKYFGVWFLGSLFLVSAILKSLDPAAFAAQISFYGLIRTPWVVRLIALGLIAIEALVGAALLAGFAVRRFALPAAIGLLAAFTALLGWAWAFRNIQNCGCFGRYLPLTPAEAIGKNVILLGLAGVAWANRRAAARTPDRGMSLPAETAWRIGRAGLVALLPLAVTAVAVLRAPESTLTRQPAPPAGAARPAGPFAGYQLAWQGRELNLARDTCLVAVFSESCAHCVDNLEPLDKLSATPGLPPVAGLVLGEEDVVKEFAKTYEPHFPLKALDALEYMNLIGDAPARFILIHEGRPVHSWDTLPPTAEALKEWLPK